MYKSNWKNWRMEQGWQSQKVHKQDCRDNIHVHVHLYSCFWVMQLNQNWLTEPSVAGTTVSPLYSVTDQSESSELSLCTIVEELGCHGYEPGDLDPTLNDCCSGWVGCGGSSSGIEGVVCKVEEEGEGWAGQPKSHQHYFPPRGRLGLIGLWGWDCLCGCVIYTLCLSIW